MTQTFTEAEVETTTVKTETEQTVPPISVEPEHTTPPTPVEAEQRDWKTLVLAPLTLLATGAITFFVVRRWLYNSGHFI